MRPERRLLHSELEAVAGLTGNMAGLRFLYNLRCSRKLKLRI